MTKSTRGFTLIEMIGVLAIVSILAAIIVPNLITRTESVTITAEVASMKSLAISLEDFIIRTQSIPSDGIAGNWAWALGSQSAIPASQILDNDMGNPRLFFIDPFFIAEMNQQFPGFIGLPPLLPAGAAPVAASFYTQQANALGGALAIPINAVPRQLPPLRIMIVSDLRKSTAAGAPPALPAVLPTAAAFDAVWQQTLAIGDPMTEADGLVIQRVSLDHLFHRITLASAEIVNLPTYQIEDFPSQPIQPILNGHHEMLIFHGTRLALFQSAPIALQFVQVIKGPESFQYQRFGPLPNGPFTFSWVR